MRINLQLHRVQLPELYDKLESMPLYDRASYLRVLLRDISASGLQTQPSPTRIASTSQDGGSDVPSSSLMDSALAAHV